MLSFPILFLDVVHLTIGEFNAGELDVPVQRSSVISLPLASFSFRDLVRQSKQLVGAVKTDLHEYMYR